MKVILRENHEKVMETDFAKKHFDELIEQGKFLEGLTDKIECVIEPYTDQSWFSYKLRINYNQHVFFVREITYNKGKTYIHLDIYNTDFYKMGKRRQYFSGEKQADNELDRLPVYTFSKLTEKKLLSLLDREINIFNRALEIADEKENKACLEYNQIKEKLVYIGKALGIRFEETIKGQTIRFEDVYDPKTHKALYALKYHNLFVIINDKKEVDHTYGLDNIIELINLIRGGGK